jgi:deferrochelatase/peroxidase EfeB
MSSSQVDILILIHAFDEESLQQVLEDEFEPVARICRRSAPQPLVRNRDLD